MPTRSKRGSTSQNTTGRSTSGGQKAVTGSGRSPEVAAEVKKATNKVVVNHEEQVAPDQA